ncbi:MAG: hypothetical protein NXI13_17635 [Proteobacteria bacterium]|nr:hypothetical protein [Pseudomonadota bacterium]
MGKLNWIVLSVFLLTGVLDNAQADDTDMVYQSAEIEEAFLIIPDDGGMSELHFKIINQSTSTLTILGVAGAEQIRSRIIARLDDERFTELGSISLGPEESLDLTTSHMSVWISGLSESLIKTGKVNLNIILSDGKLPFSAHILKGS